MSKRVLLVAAPTLSARVACEKAVEMANAMDGQVFLLAVGESETDARDTLDDFKNLCRKALDEAENGVGEELIMDDASLANFKDADEARANVIMKAARDSRVARIVCARWLFSADEPKKKEKKTPLLKKKVKKESMGKDVMRLVKLISSQKGEDAEIQLFLVSYSSDVLARFPVTAKNEKELIEMRHRFAKTKKFSEEQSRELVDAFFRHDGDASGGLDDAELKELLLEFGVNADTDAAVAKELADFEDPMVVDFVDYVQLWCTLKEKHGKEPTRRRKSSAGIMPKLSLPLIGGASSATTTTTTTTTTKAGSGGSDADDDGDNVSGAVHPKVREKKKDRKKRLSVGSKVLQALSPRGHKKESDDEASF